MNNAVKELLHTRVSEILYYVWDPIGINDTPEARDEYDSYVPKIVDVIISGANVEAITKMLFDIETKSMELSGNLARCKDVSELLIHWHAVLKEQ